MADYKLSYFDMAASRGEECRLALVLAGVEFEDDRIPYADWPKRKAEMPFGAVPVLTVMGKGTLSQSNAILNYIGTLHGLRPSEPWAAARHDAVMESVEETRTKIWSGLRVGQTEDEKRAARSEMVEKVVLTWGSQIQTQLAGTFVCGEAIQVADLKVWALCQWLQSGVIEYVEREVLRPFEKLGALHRAVENDPRVAGFRARHKR